MRNETFYSIEIPLSAGCFGFMIAFSGYTFVPVGIALVWLLLTIILVKKWLG